MSRSNNDPKMDEVLKKIEELSADLEPPPLQETEAAPKVESKQESNGTPSLGKEAFDELEKQATETTNLMTTNQGLLESILVEVQDIGRYMKEMLG